MPNEARTFSLSNEGEKSLQDIDIDINSIDMDELEIKLEIKPVNLTGPEALIEFARQTQNGGTWVYDFIGDLLEARAFVHAFRVHLSRIRRRAIDLNRPLKPFRTRVRYTKLEERKIRIAIHRSVKEIEAMRALDEVLDAISWGADQIAETKDASTGTESETGWEDLDETLPNKINFPRTSEEINDDKLLAAIKKTSLGEVEK